MPNAADPLRTLRLAALAVSERLRLRAARTASSLRPAGLGALPSRALGLAAALARLLRSRWIALFFAIGVLPLAVLLAQTSPSGPLLPLGPAADRFFMGQLASDTFLLDAPDFVAGRCADGRVERRGVDGCEGFRPIADARAMFSDAVAAYRGSASASLSPERAAAARDLAASMKKARFGSCFLDAAFFFVASIEALLVLVGGLVALGLLLRGGPFGAAVNAFGDRFSKRLAEGRQPAPPPAPGAAPFTRPIAMAMSMLFFMIVCGSFACGFFFVEAFRLAPNSALGDFAVESMAYKDSYVSRRGSPMALVERGARDGWVSPPNNYALVNAEISRELTQSSPALGQWTPSEMFSAQAPRLLAERAPTLTPAQRAAALFEFKRLQDRLSNIFFSAFVPGFPAFVMFAAFCFALAGLCKGLRALGRSGKQAISRLADEGARLPFARQEREELLGAVGDPSPEDGERPRRDPPRL
jgi:hypothetical protein